MIQSFDHIQLTIQAGQLDAALAFYVDFLGFTRVPKPSTMRQSGAWLTSGSVNLHLGETNENNGDEEENLSLPRNSHPAFRVDNFVQIMETATQKGLKTRVDSGPSGYLRGSVWDPFGNRIELMQAL
jgi:4-hydroxyphenylpyruvate dioxygenase-like putative hemolysin